MVTRVLSAAAATLLLASAAFAQAPESPFVNNQIKYKDSGSKPATGRSGNASIDASALVGKDNITTVAVSANGALEKVQLKLTATETTHNFNDLSSNTFSTTFNDLGRGDALRIQASVSGVDGARTGVVTVDTTVARKPDLAVVEVSSAPHGYVGGPFRVTATIRELNGDTGARGNCVLSIDGVDADRADNIWVDAGGTVSCMFAPEFTSAGDKQLAVRIETTSPSDYDDANNSASASPVKVYDEANAFSSWEGYANDRNFTRYYREESPNRHEETLEQGWSSSTSLNTTIIGGGLDFYNIRASVVEWNDGQVVREINNSPFEFYINNQRPFPRHPCGISYVHPDQFFEMCQRPGFRGSQPLFWLNATRASGDVTYRSQGWETTYWTTPAGTYTWNRAEQNTWGLQTRLGSNVAWRLTLSDGTRFFELDAAIDLVPGTFQYGSPWSCYSTASGPSCRESSYTDQSVAGSGWGPIQ